MQIFSAVSGFGDESWPTACELGVCVSVTRCHGVPSERVRVLSRGVLDVCLCGDCVHASSSTGRDGLLSEGKG